MIVTERYELPRLIKTVLHNNEPQFGFGTLGQIVYARTYSRVRADGGQESWADTVIRNVEGWGSIYKWWHVQNRLPYDQEKADSLAMRMAKAIYDFRFLPPGRSLWIGGVDAVYSMGSMALNNCAFVEVTDLARDATWAMDALMLGVGVGFGVREASLRTQWPNLETETYVIPDTREGWVESVRRLIESYNLGERSEYAANPHKTIEFDYSLIRPAGAPIRGFGGTASGPAPLIELHERLRRYLKAHALGECSDTRLIVDVMNAIGACVVAGNVRRSAEIACGSASDAEFWTLKNYELHPERAEIGWMSNNSIVLATKDDFRYLPEIAEGIRLNGEPGVMNLLNVQKYGRYGEESPDMATGCNPCAEIALESYELCNLVEVFPSRNATEADFYEAVELATIYASTISLLPTHSELTNSVIARNHRLGVSLSGVADWFDTEGASNIITMMRKGYDIVRSTNKAFARKMGVPESVRVTTVKPSGTISQLAGVSPGMHYPVYRRFIRRIRFGADTPLVPLLIEAGVPHEEDAYSANTLVFEFPVETTARRSQRDLSAWQKAAMVVLLQKHWADNMVSNTITFDPKTEGHQIEDLLAFTVPFTKTVSMLPDTDEGAYPQMPYQSITVKEYEERKGQIRPINWAKFSGSDGEDSRYCSNDLCLI